MDVDFAQGFGLHKPEPLSQIEATLRESDGTRSLHTLIVA